MKQKTPENLPENQNENGRRWPPLDAVKEHIALLDRTPEKDSDAFKEQLTYAYVEAGLLDKNLQTHLAESLEKDPRIAKLMRDKNLSKWREINHEQMAA